MTSQSPKAVGFAPPTECSRLSRYFPHLEKHHTHGNSPEMYAHPDFYLSNEKHDRPQNTYHTPLVMMDDAEHQGFSILKCKETSPSGSVASMIVPCYEADISNFLPKMASSQAKNDSGTSNTAVNVMGVKNGLVSAPDICLGQERYFR
jgi:hypothetical protein